MAGSAPSERSAGPMPGWPTCGPTDIHKLTTRLSQTHAVIGAETLAIKNMMAAGGARKRGLNRAWVTPAWARCSANSTTRRLVRLTDRQGRPMVSQHEIVLRLRCGESQAAPGGADLRMRKLRAGIDRDLNAAVNLARYAQRETDPSTGVVTGGADRKPSPHGDAGGNETRTRAEVGDTTPMTVGVPPPKERLPEMPSHTNTHISGNGCYSASTFTRRRPDA